MFTQFVGPKIFYFLLANLVLYDLNEGYIRKKKLLKWGTLAIKTLFFFSATYESGSPSYLQFKLFRVQLALELQPIMM